MSASKLKVGIIGAGVGRLHIEGYLSNPNTELVALCDIDEGLLAQRREEFNLGEDVRSMKDYRELVAMPEIALVSVTSPDYFHAEQSIAVMEAGKDVLCEKPLTLDLAESKQIVEAVEETGRRFMVGQVCRYAPGFVLAKRMVERGDIGDIFLVESEYAHNYEFVRGSDEWRVDPRRHPFIGGGCHAVDLLRWVAGDAQEAFAYANHKCLTDWPVDDCTMAVFKLENNVIGKVMVSIGCVRPYTMRSVFYGTDGTIICANTSETIQLCTRTYGDRSPQFAEFPVDLKSHNVAAEIEEMVDAILNDKPPVTDVYEGARTVAACVAAVESAKSGKPVKVEAIGKGRSAMKK